MTAQIDQQTAENGLNQTILPPLAPESSQKAANLPSTPTPRQVQKVRTLSLEMVSPRAQIFKGINAKLPANDIGMPKHIYRVDLIPMEFNQLSLLEQSEYLDNALVELDYSQGYPSLADGTPFWCKFPYESGEAFDAFQTYLEMPRLNLKNLAKVAPNPEEALNMISQDSGMLDSTTPIRQIHLLQGLTGKTSAQLVEFFHCYCWAERAKSYDLFIVAYHNKRKDSRLMNIEDSHFQKAEHYLNYSTQWLDDLFRDPDRMAQIKPKDMIDLMLKMMQVQRISAGATANGQSAKDGDGNNSQHAPLEVILRTLTQKHMASAPSKAQEEQGDVDMKLLYDNPEMLEQAQELIIRMNTATNPRSNNNRMPEINHFENLGNT